MTKHINPTFYENVAFKGRQGTGQLTLSDKKMRFFLKANNNRRAGENETVEVFKMSWKSYVKHNVTSEASQKLFLKVVYLSNEHGNAELLPEEEAIFRLPSRENLDRIHQEIIERVQNYQEHQAQSLGMSQSTFNESKDFTASMRNHHERSPRPPPVPVPVPTQAVNVSSRAAPTSLVDTNPQGEKFQKEKPGGLTNNGYSCEGDTMKEDDDSGELDPLVEPASDKSRDVESGEVFANEEQEPLKESSQGENASSMSSTKKHIAWIFGINALLLVVLLAFLGLALYDVIERNMPADATKPPLPGDVILPYYTMESINDPTTPQAKAYDWLLRHGQLYSMPDWRKTQLFVYATICFSMFDGDEEKAQRQNYLNGHVPECDWGNGDNYCDDYYEESEGRLSYIVFMPFEESSSSAHTNNSDPLLLEPDPQNISHGFAIPPEIVLLTSLNTLGVAFMQPYPVAILVDVLPSTLGYLDNIEVLALEHMGLGGGIPGTELGYMNKLGTLLLNDNALIGTFPSELHQSTSLSTITFGGNKLSGSLCSEVGLMAGLNDLDLSRNYLSRNLPSQIGLMSNLRSLNLSGNVFSGVIPSEVARMNSLEVLDLAENNFSRPLPSELGQMSYLTHLNLTANKISNRIPTELGMVSLKTLSLARNLLSSSIPSMLGVRQGYYSSYSDTYDWESAPLASNLKWLDISSNMLAGQIPSELGMMTMLSHLDLSSNKLVGPIPSQFGSMSELSTVILASNSLTGTLPSRLGGERGFYDYTAGTYNYTGTLSHLDLSNNQLTQSIPSEWGIMMNLTHLDLSNNRLSKSVPSELGLLTRLEYVNIAGNMLTGTIPESWCRAFQKKSARINCGTVSCPSQCQQCPC